VLYSLLNSVCLSIYGYTLQGDSIFDEYEDPTMERQLWMKYNYCCGSKGAVFTNRTQLQDAISLYVSDYDTALTSYGDIGCWNVTKVTDMSFLFFDKNSFNEDIGCWDVSNVLYMANMFSFASSFNQPIGYWDVSKVRTMQSMFSGASSFNQQISDWDVSSVKDMSYMFFQATSFDQSISSWDVSSVKYSFSMFAGAHSFNQYVGGWNLASDQIISYMFYGATSFNQNLCGWYKRGMSPTAAVDVLKGSACAIATDPDFSAKESFCQSCYTKSSTKIKVASASFKSSASLLINIAISVSLAAFLMK
jgi:surface protein